MMVVVLPPRTGLATSSCPPILLNMLRRWVTRRAWHRWHRLLNGDGVVDVDGVVGFRAAVA